MRSPATAHAQTIPMSVTTLIWPWPATRPPSSIAVSPGAIRPMNAPVSKNARAPTSTYVHGPSVSPTLISDSSRFGSLTRPVP